MKKDTNCIVCGANLIKLQQPEDITCYFCNDEFSADIKCINHHYVCDICYNMPAIDIIEQFCDVTEITNPIEIANILMQHPQVNIHGAEHLFLVPAVIITSHYNTIGDIKQKKEKLKIAKECCTLANKNNCNVYAAYNIGISAGVAFSILNEIRGDYNNQWQLSNKLISECLIEMAKHNGPRCCKRDTFIAIPETVRFLKEHRNIEIAIPDIIVCHFSNENTECTKEECRYYNG